MLLLLIALIVANASGAVDFRRYHLTVGIPAAERRLEMERRIMESEDDAVNTRIIGGQKTDHLHFPWLAGLLVTLHNNAGRSLCSGSLISSTRVLTAAHCWTDEDLIGFYVEVVLGSDFLYYGGTRIWSYNVVEHPDSKVTNVTTQYPVDIAMILLRDPVNFSPTIKPIALPTPYKSQTFVRYASFAAGYGYTSDKPKVKADQNRYVELNVLPNKECNVLGYNSTLIKTLLCTSGKGKVGVCNGDSGGPLSIKICGEDILIGVIHGFPEIGCETGRPSFHVRVTEVIGWIVTHL